MEQLPTKNDAIVAKLREKLKTLKASLAEKPEVTVAVDGEEVAEGIEDQETQSANGENILQTIEAIEKALAWREKAPNGICFVCYQKGETKEIEDNRLEVASDAITCIEHIDENVNMVDIENAVV